MAKPPPIKSIGETLWNTNRITVFDFSLDGTIEIDKV